MDRVTQRRKKGNRLIGQRYLLQSSLVSNSVGTLYQARDMCAPEAAAAQVLIHLLSPNAVRSTPLGLMTERLQALCAATDEAVLKVLESGWSGSNPYFVLVSPTTWNLSILPSMLGQTTRLHEQALALNQRLADQGILQTVLATSLFLVSAEGKVYLPSTALVASLNYSSESPALLLTAHLTSKRSPKAIFPLAGLGFIGVVVASGTGLYYQNHVQLSQAIIQASALPSNNSSLLESPELSEIPLALSTTTATSLADTAVPSVAPPPPATQATIPAAELKLKQIAKSTEPVSKPIQFNTNSAQPTTQVSTAPSSVIFDPEPGDMRLALAREPSSTRLNPEMQPPTDISTKPKKDKKIAAEDLKPVVTKTTTKVAKAPPPKAAATEEFVEETDPEVNLPSPRSGLIRAQASSLPSAQFTPSSALPNALAIVPAPRPMAVANTAQVLGVVNPIVVPVATTPVVRLQAPVMERDPEALTANGMTSDALVKKAYQALQAGQLDEQANRGTIYFIRLLDRIDHGNPQIIRLARETGYQLHQQVRTALVQGDAEQASKKLWRAGRIIKEFNLTPLNPAQELLEHKLIE